MTRLRLGLLAACALATLACESPPPRRRAKRPTESQPRTGQVATSGGSSKSVRLPPGHVAFAFEDADLETHVLPLFERQAGVVILWEGEPRTLSLRLTNPTPWQNALDLVCQFTRTHATRDWQGRLILKDGWHGRPTSETLDDITGSGTRGSGSVSSGRSGASGASSGSGYQGGSSPRANPTPFGSAYSGGAAADRILKGTTTTQAGGR